MRARDYLFSSWLLLCGSGWEALRGGKPMATWIPLLGWSLSLATIAAIIWLWGKRGSLPRYRIRIKRVYAAKERS